MSHAGANWFWPGLVSKNNLRATGRANARAWVARQLDNSLIHQWDRRKESRGPPVQKSHVTVQKIVIILAGRTVILGVHWEWIIYGRLIETGKIFVRGRGPFCTPSPGTTSGLRPGRAAGRGSHSGLEQVQPRTCHRWLRAVRHHGGGGGGGEGVALAKAVSCGRRPYPVGDGGPVHSAFGFLHDRRGGLDWKARRREGGGGFYRAARRIGGTDFNSPD